MDKKKRKMLPKIDNLLLVTSTARTSLFNMHQNIIMSLNDINKQTKAVDARTSNQNMKG